MNGQTHSPWKNTTWSPAGGGSYVDPLDMFLSEEQKAGPATTAGGKSMRGLVWDPYKKSFVSRREFGQQNPDLGSDYEFRGYGEDGSPMRNDGLSVGQFQTQQGDPAARTNNSAAWERIKQREMFGRRRRAWQPGDSPLVQYKSQPAISSPRSWSTGRGRSNFSKPFSGFGQSGNM